MKPIAGRIRTVQEVAAAMRIGEGSQAVAATAENRGQMTISLPYPISSNRYWRHVVIGRSARTLVSREAEAYRGTVRAACAESAVRPLDGELDVTITLHPKRTADGRAYKRRVDLDNACKVVLDSLQGLAFADDAQVVALHARVGSACDGGALTVRIQTAGAA